jgi:soluble lytic murein transglycosylase
MLGTFALILAATAADPRPDLVELQLANQHRQALARVEQELAERPGPSHKLGLDYLRGHLLDALSRFEDATAAFLRTLAEAPPLKLHAYYRVAYDYDLLGHPEMATGLVANTAAGDPSSPLLPEAVRLLARTIVRGGDCKLLRLLRTEAMPAPQRREVQLAQGYCAQRTGFPEIARGLLVSLLGESQDDEIARQAAERLTATISESEHGRVPLLIGITFQRHNDFDRALVMLQRALGKGDGLPAREAYETQVRMGEIQLSQQRWAEASLAFTRLANTARSAADRAHALYLEGRSHELRGAVATADRNFLQAYAAEPQGAWAPRALLSALRVEWKAGSESQALSLYEKLTVDPKWRPEAARAALFLAASDLVRGRRDRVGVWLTKARQGGHDDRLEADYWNGRLAELEKNGQEAVARYLDVLRTDLYHPLARRARVRLAAEPLARIAAAEGRRLAGSDRLNDVYGAWLLLGGDPAGRAVQRRLEQMLLGDRRAAPFLRMAEVPVRRWPLWDKPQTKPEEMLLALGVWHSGSAAIRTHFPLSDPSLGFTGTLLLARGGDVAGSIAMAESLRERAPSRVPLALQPAEYRRLLYPFPYRQNILAVGPIHGVPPDLLVALIREESRFDTSMLSPASSRGLTHLSLNTARRLASQLNLQQRLTPENLYRPEVSITLGAAYLGALLKDFSGNALAAVAAYDAGEAEVILWRSQCFTQEPEELYTKLGTAETRDYVRRVLGSWEEYGALY